MNQSVNRIVAWSYVPLIKAVDLKFAVSIMAVAFRGVLRVPQFSGSAAATQFKKVA